MFKKVPFLMVFALFAFHSQAQTIVSTTPENKNVILEEFTGIHCVYCPQGHAISQGIQDANPGDVYLINVHTGGYANPGPGEPDFRTAFGTALANQSGLTGYPSGTVNRALFPSLSMGSGTAMGRGQWATAATQILAESSYVNVGVEATIDVQTRELTVHVEAYYTGNSPEATNLLNVALLQNNTKGPQVGGNAGSEYIHMHRLVHLLTGQWGQTISTTTSGSFVDQTFTYTIPADYNTIPAELGDMEIVAFVSETHQDIISGSGAYPTFTNFVNVNDALVKSVEEVPVTCSGSITPELAILNNGSATMTSVDFEYSVNGGPVSTYTATGLNLTSLQETSVSLPSIAFTSQTTNTLNIAILNDDDASNNAGTATFNQSIEGTGSVYMVLNTDDWGEECTWNVKDSAGTILYSGGPYPAQDNATINESFQLPDDCITFTITDAYGDGGGSVTLTDSDGTQLFYSNGDYGSGTSREFGSNGILSIDPAEFQNEISVYPNPTHDNLFIANAENASIEIFNVLGKRIVVQSDIASNEQINVSNLQTGTYFIRITSENKVETKKFVVTK